jgi:hypothetical protein
VSHLELLGEAEVHQLDIAGGVQQQVLRLEVPVDDAPAVQVVECLHHAGSVEPGRRVVEVAPVPEREQTCLSDVL